MVENGRQIFHFQLEPSVRPPTTTDHTTTMTAAITGDMADRPPFLPRVPPRRPRRAALLACFALALAPAGPAPCGAFRPAPASRPAPGQRSTPRPSSALLAIEAAVDPVTYLRTEWVAAALVTNQTPRAADVVLQLGTEDGRIVNFVPRTVRCVSDGRGEGCGEGRGRGCGVGRRSRALGRGVGGRLGRCSNNK